MIPIGLKPTLLHLTIPRLRCRRCGAIRWPHLPFADPKKRYIKAFGRFVIELLQWTTIKGAARLLGVGWDLVKDIHKSWLRKRYRAIPLHKIKYLGIDEFSIRKGHSYMTIGVDLETGRIVYAAEGKSAGTLWPLIMKLRKSRKIKAIAMDMNPGYISAVLTHLPHVDIVFDHYHVSALINKALDELRRDQQKEMERLGQRTFIKGSRFLLLKNYEKVSGERKHRLKSLFQINGPLNTMHLMKEQFRDFWDKLTVADAESFLENWCQDADNSGIRHLKKVSKTLRAHRYGLMNYFKHRITTAKVEGLNNKIKTLSKQAYGFRDMEYFKLRLYHLNEQRYSLTG